MTSTSAVSAIVFALGACGDNGAALDAGAGTCSEPPGIGNGSVELIVNALTPPQTDAFTQFSLGPAITAPSACTITQAGPCSVSVCPRINTGPDCAEPMVGAGAIAFSGGLIAIATAADKNEGGQMVVWSGGERLDVTAAGDPNGVPAFAQTVIAPSPFTLTSPSFASPVVIDRESPLEIIWSGGVTGEIIVTLSHDVPPEPTYQTMTCMAQASSNLLTIPASAFVPMGSGAGSIDITNSMSATFTA